MGYGGSKLVAERILAEAAKKSGVQSIICRLGQIAGPMNIGREKGVWNRKKWLPTVSTALAVEVPDFSDSMVDYRHAFWAWSHT